MLFPYLIQLPVCVQSLTDLLSSARIPPAVNQVEAHAHWQQRGLLDFCKRTGVLLPARAVYVRRAGGVDSAVCSSGQNVLHHAALGASVGSIRALLAMQEVTDEMLDARSQSLEELRLYENALTVLGDGSLLSVIDRTVSGAGSRLLASRLASPLTDVAEIRRRQDAPDDDE